MAENTKNKTAADPAETEGVVGASVFTAGDAALAVPFSGLLTDQPELRGQELAPSVWRSKLDEYINSPRP